ncbi:hypothetical protein [Spiroplasma endosymbiont of Nephrotoma flavescens]|uniref:hypothetical protein n=2 Tax=unclassified Spiroplasma TaxID=2637901 RepID=UPI00313DCEAF
MGLVKENQDIKEQVIDNLLIDNVIEAPLDKVTDLRIILDTDKIISDDVFVVEKDIEFKEFFVLLIGKTIGTKPQQITVSRKVKFVFEIENPELLAAQKALNEVSLKEITISELVIRGSNITTLIASKVQELIASIQSPDFTDLSFALKDKVIPAPNAGLLINIGVRLIAKAKDSEQSRVRSEKTVMVNFTNIKTQAEDDAEKIMAARTALDSIVLKEIVFSESFIIGKNITVTLARLQETIAGIVSSDFANLKIAFKSGGSSFIYQVADLTTTSFMMDVIISANAKDSKKTLVSNPTKKVKVKFTLIQHPAQVEIDNLVLEAITVDDLVIRGDDIKAVINAKLLAMSTTIKGKEFKQLQIILKDSTLIAPSSGNSLSVKVILTAKANLDNTTITNDKKTVTVNFADIKTRDEDNKEKIKQAQNALDSLILKDINVSGTFYIGQEIKISATKLQEAIAGLTNINFTNLTIAFKNTDSYQVVDLTTKFFNLDVVLTAKAKDTNVTVVSNTTQKVKVNFIAIVNPEQAKIDAAQKALDKLLLKDFSLQTKILTDANVMKLISLELKSAISGLESNDFTNLTIELKDKTKILSYAEAKEKYEAEGTSVPVDVIVKAHAKDKNKMEVTNDKYTVKVDLAIFIAQEELNISYLKLALQFLNLKAITLAGNVVRGEDVTLKIKEILNDAIKDVYDPATSKVIANLQIALKDATIVLKIPLTGNSMEIDVIISATNKNGSVNRVPIDDKVIVNFTVK